MKVQLRMNGEVIEVSRLVIIINNNEFRLSENSQKELVINKAPLNDEQLLITPSAGNEFKVK